LIRQKKDSKKDGFKYLNLCTDFYEKYGFKYIGQSYPSLERRIKNLSNTILVTVKKHQQTNAVVYFELPVKDMERVITFHQTSFGYTFKTGSYGRLRNGFFSVR